jgi:hypothetical protein
MFEQIRDRRHRCRDAQVIDRPVNLGIAIVVV